MKRLGALFGAILCFLPLLATPREVTIWHAYRGAEEQALREAADTFNRRNDRWRVVLLAVPYDAFTSKLVNAVPRGNGPDAFIAAHEWIGGWAAGGLITPLPDETGREIAAAMLPTTATAVTSDNRLWAIPLTFKSLVLFYRTDLIERPPQTTAELIAQARLFSDPAKGRYGLAFEAASAYYAVPFLHAFGGGLCLGEGATTPCLDHAGNRAALGYLARLIPRERIVPEEATAARCPRPLCDKRTVVCRRDRPRCPL